MVGWRGVLMSLAGDGSPGQRQLQPRALAANHCCSYYIMVFYIYGFTALKSITSIISGK